MGTIATVYSFNNLYFSSTDISYRNTVKIL